MQNGKIRIVDRKHDIFIENLIDMNIYFKKSLRKIKIESSIKRIIYKRQINE